MLGKPGYYLLLLHVGPGCDIQDKVAHLLPMSVRRREGIRLDDMILVSIIGSVGIYNSGIFEAPGYHFLLLHVGPGCDIQDKVAHLLPMSVRRREGIRLDDMILVSIIGSVGIYNSGIFEAPGYHFLLLHVGPGCDVHDKVAHLLPMSVSRNEGMRLDVICMYLSEWSYITVGYLRHQATTFFCCMHTGPGCDIRDKVAHLLPMPVSRKEGMSLDVICMYLCEWSNITVGYMRHQATTLFLLHAYWAELWYTV